MNDILYHITQLCFLPIPKCSHFRTVHCAFLLSPSAVTLNFAICVVLGFLDFPLKIEMCLVNSKSSDRLLVFHLATKICASQFWSISAPSNARRQSRRRDRNITIKGILNIMQYMPIRIYLTFQYFLISLSHFARLTVSIPLSPQLPLAARACPYVLYRPTLKLSHSVLLLQTPTLLWSSPLFHSSPNLYKMHPYFPTWFTILQGLLHPPRHASRCVHRQSESSLQPSCMSDGMESFCSTCHIDHNNKPVDISIKVAGVGYGIKT